MITVSHSELSTFRECPRKWSLRYRLNRVTRTPSDALRTGKRVDLALRGDAVELPPQERALVEGHAMRWADSKLHVTQDGVWFTARISDDVEVIGELDAIGTVDGHEVIVERKTTSQDIGPGSQYWRRVMHVDPQVSLYLIARPTAEFVLYDVLRKPALRGKAGETDEQLHRRTLATIAEDPEKYYQRAHIVRFEEERRSHVRDVLGTVHLMQAAERDPPRNVDACFRWGECEYFSVCSGEVTIDDESRYMDRSRSHRNQAPAAAGTVRPERGGQEHPRQPPPEAPRYRF